MAWIYRISGPMHLSVLGFNHRSAPLETREPFQLGRADLEAATRLYRDLSQCAEAAVVATCHRVEFYRVSPRKEGLLQDAVAFYRQWGAPQPERLKEVTYRFHGTSAARHLFRVASGLDSLVLGEDQVLHQLKEAYSAACAASGPGKVLHKIFHLSFQAGKRVRSETGLGAGPRGLPGAAMDLLRRRYEGQAPKSALVCGVNEITEIILDDLARWGVPAVLVNRTLSRAEKLAGAFGVPALPLDRLGEALGRAEVVFSATAAPGYVITEDHLAGVPEGAGPRCLVDLAVPRDIDPDLGRRPGLVLYDLQDLKKYLEHTENQRAQEIPAAETIVEELVRQYSTWCAQERMQGKILDLHRDLNLARRQELEHFKDGFRPSEHRALEAFSHALVRNFMRLAPRLLEDPPEEAAGG